MAFCGEEYNRTYLQLLPYELQEIVEHEVQRFKFNEVVSDMLREIENKTTGNNYLDVIDGIEGGKYFTKYQIKLNAIMTIISSIGTGIHNDNTINFIHTHSVFREILFWIKINYSSKLPISQEYIYLLNDHGDNVNMLRVPISIRGQDIENKIVELQRYRWMRNGPRRSISPYMYFQYIEQALLILEYMEILSLHAYLTRQYNDELIVMGITY